MGSFLQSISLTILMPVTMLLITCEIVLASYKSFSTEWTKKLAIGNFIVNMLWTLLILIIVLKPALIEHALASFFAGIFQKSPEDLYSQVRWIIIGVGLATLVTTAVDAFSGFRQSSAESRETDLE